MENWDPDSIEHIEELKLILLIRSKEDPGIVSLSIGSINGTVTDVRIILQNVIKAKADASASSIIICHNHTGGNVRPGESDLTITRKIKESGNLMDNLIIVPEEKYYSKADEGLL